MIFGEAEKSGWLRRSKLIFAVFHVDQGVFGGDSGQIRGLNELRDDWFLIRRSGVLPFGIVEGHIGVPSTLPCRLLCCCNLETHALTAVTPVNDVIFAATEMLGMGNGLFDWGELDREVLRRLLVRCCLVEQRIDEVGHVRATTLTELALISGQDRISSVGGWFEPTEGTMAGFPAS